MSKIALIVTATAALGITMPAFGTADAKSTLKFKAQLNAGQEVPKQAIPAKGASGRFTATLMGDKLVWKLTFRNLSSQALAAHIHLGPPGKAGGIIVPLCAPCEPRAVPQGAASGTATVSPTDIQALKAKQTYVNVHTSKNPKGEIRGTVTRAM